MLKEVVLFCALVAVTVAVSPKGPKRYRPIVSETNVVPNENYGYGGDEGEKEEEGKPYGTRGNGPYGNESDGDEFSAMEFMVVDLMVMGLVAMDLIVMTMMMIMALSMLKAIKSARFSKKNDELRTL